MISKNVFLFFTIVFLVGCGDKPLVPETMSFDQTELSTCDTAPCPEVTVDYLKYTGEEAVVKIINDSIQNFILNSLYLGDAQTAPIGKNIPDAVEGFIKAYWVDTSEFPDINEYDANVAIEQIFKNDELVSLAMSQYKYTGGAHGYGSTQFQNFDTETGIALTNEQLFQNVHEFTAFAEAKFRKTFHISDEDSVNGDRFWFKEDTFYVPENIGFTTESVLIHYNQYEIASYADGPIEIEISLLEAASYLKYDLE